MSFTKLNKISELQLCLSLRLQFYCIKDGFDLSTTVHGVKFKPLNLSILKAKPS